MEVDERPTEDYNDVGGLDKQIQELVEAIVLPMTHAERFKNIGIQAPKGICAGEYVFVAPELYFINTLGLTCGMDIPIPACVCRCSRMPAVRAAGDRQDADGPRMRRPDAVHIPQARRSVGNMMTEYLNR
jgi:hypothetical protein